VDSLAKATRGLIESEIRECVEKYLKSGDSPVELNHPSNTCDPFTGNWAEHIMDVNHLANILSHGGFEVDVKAGYYPQTSKRFSKKFLAHLLNPLISLLKSKGLVLSPFYTIFGRKGYI
jgi:hypothetical protein